MEDVVAESEHVEQARHPLQRVLDGRLDVEGEVLFGVGYLAAVAVGYGASTADQPAAEVVDEVDEDEGGSLDGQVMSIPQPATCFFQPTGVYVGGSGGAHFGAEPGRGPTPRAAQIAKNSRAKAEARRPWHDSQLVHQVGRSPGKDVQNGDRGEEEAPSPPFVHAGVQGRDRGALPGR